MKVDSNCSLMCLLDATCRHRREHILHFALGVLDYAGKYTQGSTRLTPYYVLTMLQDVNSFARLVRGLSENKAPGLEEVPNEILKWLPDGVLADFHAVFVAAYSVQLTSNFLKVSKAVLI